ncbi:5267_t:CDS:2, partial [Scutellospora calospora]
MEKVIPCFRKHGKYSVFPVQKHGKACYKMLHYVEFRNEDSKIQLSAKIGNQ